MHAPPLPVIVNGCHTAAKFALALGISKRAVLNALAGTSPSGTAIVSGNQAPAWSVTDLPDRLREALATKANRAGLSIADYLASVAAPWQPELALSEISPACLADAVKLQKALLPTLQRVGAVSVTPADLGRALGDFKNVHGYSVTSRHLLRLLDRTQRRAGASADFTRLELYLSEKPGRLPENVRLAPHEQSYRTLADTIQAFADPLKPTRTEMAVLWCEAFEIHTAGTGTLRERKALLKFLGRHAPWLAENPRALRIAFNRKLEAWEKGGRQPVAIMDGRIQKRGMSTAPPIPQPDLDTIIGHAALYCGGRVAQAVRELSEQGPKSGLSKETVTLITQHSGSKSYVNRRLAKAVTPEVRMVTPFTLGKKAIDDATAHISRDYSKLSSMQVICADDFTFPVYFYTFDDSGQPFLTRGQCLVMMDVRSWKVVAWSLQPERNYNSFVIRTLMNRVCAGWGLPGVWYFERGIWKSSKLVKGAAPIGWRDAASPAEMQVGWQSVGVRFVHAIRARSKPVERLGGMLQSLMERVRGYCGRDERRDCPTVTKRAMDDFNARRYQHPGELFLSFDEWETELGRLIDNYNASSQDGDTLRGLSPDEAFEQFWPHDNPPAKFDAHCWHLVAHFVREVPVTTNGISFRIGNKRFIYRNDRTGMDRGKTVLAWFDPECPDLLCVTDMNKRNPYLVDRSVGVDFMAQPGDAGFEKELANTAGHNRHSKARFHVLKAKFAPTFRRNIVDAETAETAQAITQQRETRIAERREQTTQTDKARKAFGRLGMSTPTPDRLRPGQIEAARKLAELLESDETDTPPNK